MALRWFVRTNVYYDSVRLMRVSEMLSALPGVTRAAAVMATPLNIELLRDDGLLPEGARATTDDLVVAVASDDEAAAEAALAQVEEMLQPRAVAQAEATAAAPRTIERAAAVSRAGLAVIGVPGRSAAVEAFAALRAGLHVFLFSDNVSLRDESRLKRLAADRGLLMMGPDCGTAIIDGVGLGFANRVARGPVGIVGASGTGIQQVSCLLDLAGIGTAAAIGTGGRDLSGAVRGSMTRRALGILATDDNVEIVAVISKPAAESAARLLQRDLARLGKPAVVCLLGAAPREEDGVRYVATLSDAAQAIADRLGGDTSRWFAPETLPASTGQRVVTGFFAGGTLCSEAAQVLDAMEVPHRLIDLGSDEYTRGRAHPMIDGRLRSGMIAEWAERAAQPVLLLDVVLGDLAHPDPAGALAPTLHALGRERTVVVTLVGTRADPQNLDRQRATLEDTGALVFASNAAAAAAAGRLAGGAR